MRTIQEQWNIYRAEVVPANAPDIQVTECRVAFYAGAHVMLNSAIELADLTEEVGGKILSGYHDELLRFVADHVKNV